MVLKNPTKAIGLAACIATAASIASASPARALVGYQNAGPGVFSFTKTGSGQTNFNPTASFQTFNPGLVPGSRLNPQLFAYRFVITATVGGTITSSYFNVSNTSNPVTGTSSAKVIIGFDPLGIGGQNVTATINAQPFSYSFNTGVVTTPPPEQAVIGYAGGQQYNVTAPAYTGNSLPISINPLDLASFTVPSANQISQFFDASWSSTNSNPSVADNFSNATINGTLGVQWIYNYTEDVPAPLPILGAASAFGWSRRLRKRIALRKQTSLTV